jgi:hypothetical protein
MRFSAKKIDVKTNVIIQILQKLAVPILNKNANFSKNFQRKYFTNHNFGPKLKEVGIKQTKQIIDNREKLPLVFFTQD